MTALQVTTLQLQQANPSSRPTGSHAADNALHRYLAHATEAKTSISGTLRVPRKSFIEHFDRAASMWSYQIIDQGGAGAVQSTCQQPLQC
jgi:hypothetical protein